MDFSMPIDFVASRTAVMHGLASWFDLDFEAHPSTRADAEGAQNTTTAADVEAAARWDEYLTLSTWPWMSTEPPLNPLEQPPPPRQGVKVVLSTGPKAPRTHWQ